MTRAERTRWLAVGILNGVAQAIKDHEAVDTFLCVEALILASHMLLQESLQIDGVPPPKALH
jgi:hypothetical protein